MPGTFDALSCIVCTFKAFISQDVTTFDAPVDVAKLELLVLATTCLRVDNLIILEGGSYSKNGHTFYLASIGWSWVVARATSKTDPRSASAGTASPSED